MLGSKKVCFVTNVYPSPLEPRMFYREAKSLVSAGYQVTFICQHSKEEILEGVKIIPLPKPMNRFDRMFRLGLKVLKLTVMQRANVYHFHSPELMPVALLLKLLGKVVIYDAHEAFEEKIMSKEWIKPQLRPIISKLFRWFEALCSKYFDHVIAADRFVASKFRHGRVTVVANYPVLSMVKKVSFMVNFRKTTGKTIVVYAGGLTKQRGLYKMIEAVEALGNLDIELHLLGHFEDSADEQVVKKARSVRYLGFMPLEKVFEHIMLANIGLALFQPVPAYFYAGENTNKLFEYMVCGLAIIASNFPNIRRFIEENNCGICVDPTSVMEISSTIRFLHENRELMLKFGENGKKAVLKQYNWEAENIKFLAIYRGLFSRYRNANSLIISR